MRRAGKAPGIVYGGAIAPQPIELDHNALFHALRNEAFHSSILTMKLSGGASRYCCAADHPFKNEILRRLSARGREPEDPHEGATALRPGDVSPAVKLAGAIGAVMAKLDITCLPDLPSS
jgi:large subunit ribosomal protein L25